MEERTTCSHSFVVRIWRTGDQPSDWRGWVQHASTGEATYVRDLSDLLAFIERWAGPLAGSSLAPAPPTVGLK